LFVFTLHSLPAPVSCSFLTYQSPVKICFSQTLLSGVAHRFLRYPGGIRAGRSLSCNKFPLTTTPFSGRGALSPESSCPALAAIAPTQHSAARLAHVVV